MIAVVIGDRIPATKDKERTMPLNDDPDALSDDEYDALLTEAEESAEPCPAAVPEHVVAAAVARLDAKDNADG